MIPDLKRPSSFCARACWFLCAISSFWLGCRPGRLLRFGDELRLMLAVRGRLRVCVCVWLVRCLLIRPLSGLVAGSTSWGVVAGVGLVLMSGGMLYFGTYLLPSVLSFWTISSGFGFARLPTPDDGRPVLTVVL